LAPRKGGDFGEVTSDPVYTSKGDLPGVSSLFAKNFSLFLSGKSSLQARPVPPEEGALAIVTNVGRDAVDALVPDDERHESGRRSRVVLTSRRWRQVGDDVLRIAPAMVTRKPDHQREHEGNR